MRKFLLWIAKHAVELTDDTFALTLCDLMRLMSLLWNDKKGKEEKSEKTMNH